MFAKLIAAVTAGTVLAAVAVHSSGGAGKPQIYTVRPGDTLWTTTAGRYAGDPREAIERVQLRNGLRSASLQPGQRLVLP